MSTLNTSILLQLLADLKREDGGVVFQPRPIVTVRYGWVDGSAVDQANRVYGPTTRTLASAAVEELDLAGGSLKDMHGDALTFTKVKMLFIRNKAKSDAVGAVLEVGGVVGTVENFLLFKSTDDIYKLGPGAFFCVGEPSAAGLPVTAGTGDLLRIANVSSPGVSISYEILIIGTG